MIARRLVVLSLPAVLLTGFSYPEQMTCKTAADCRVIESACPGWEVVNAKHADRIQAENVRSRPAIDCDSPKKLPPKPRPACTEGFCAADSGDCGALRGLLSSVIAAAGSCQTDPDCVPRFFPETSTCQLSVNRRADLGPVERLTARAKNACPPLQPLSCKKETPKARCERSRCQAYY